LFTTIDVALEDSGDLFERILLDVAQHEGGAFERGQLFERAFE
jgi:hypothetical protein